jgi:pimeloyl-ACP methyl ester carboxylesterase
VNVVAVGGTWALTGGWWQPSSAFFEAMGPQGVMPALICGEPFEWETGLGDSLKFWLSDAARTRGWLYAGKALRWYHDALPLEQRIVIAHSHGGQVAFECATMLPIHRLITVGTPVRKDMSQTVALALENIGSWMHVCDIKSDKSAWWGAFADGQVGITREFKFAHPHFLGNTKIPGIGHSGLLNDADQFHWWLDAGLIDFLKYGATT